MNFVKLKVGILPKRRAVNEKRYRSDATFYCTATAVVLKLESDVIIMFVQEMKSAVVGGSQHNT